VQTHLAGYPRLVAADRALERHGIQALILIRVSLVVPFAVQSYGLGVTRVSLRNYLVSLLAMVPGTVFYVSCGATLGSIAEIVRGKDELGWDFYVMVLGLVLLALVVMVAVRFARRALVALGVWPPASEDARSGESGAESDGDPAAGAPEST
jgi:uncharacterized membrane protein YdjX (TVP38/TMEM64 family)